MHFNCQKNFLSINIILFRLKSNPVFKCVCLCIQLCMQLSRAEQSRLLRDLQCTPPPLPENRGRTRPATAGRAEWRAESCCCKSAIKSAQTNSPPLQLHWSTPLFALSHSKTNNFFKAGVFSRAVREKNLPPCQSTNKLKHSYNLEQLQTLFSLTFVI